MMEALRGSTASAEFAQWLSWTQSGFCYEEKQGVGFFTIPMFTQTGRVKHGFSTRIGGISEGCYASLNLSFTRRHSEQETERNFGIASRALGIEPDNLVIVNGNHGVAVQHVGQHHRGDGLARAYTDQDAAFDGMITDAKQTALVTIHADCTPVFAYDPAHEAIGLCHAGWRGTVNGMIDTLIVQMQQAFHTDPSALLMAIGPNIGACCFEVDVDVAQAFERAFDQAGCVRAARKPGKYHVHLAHAAAYQMFSRGVAPDHVTMAHLCTCCNETLFHSYRRDGKQGGAMASFLQLNP